MIDIRIPGLPYFFFSSFLLMVLMIGLPKVINQFLEVGWCSNGLKATSCQIDHTLWLAAIHEHAIKFELIAGKRIGRGNVGTATSIQMVEIGGMTIS